MISIAEEALRRIGQLNEIEAAITTRRPNSAWGAPGTRGTDQPAGRASALELAPTG
jgi:hypothetical protein